MSEYENLESYSLNHDFKENGDQLIIDRGIRMLEHLRDGGFFQRVYLPYFNEEGEYEDPMLLYVVEYSGLSACVSLDLGNTPVDVRLVNQGAFGSTGDYQAFEFDKTSPDVEAFSWDGKTRTQILQQEKVFVNWVNLRGGGTSEIKPNSPRFVMYDKDSGEAFFYTRFISRDYYPIIQSSKNEDFPDEECLYVDMSAFVEARLAQNIVLLGEHLLTYDGTNKDALEFCDMMQKGFSHVFPTFIEGFK